mmetsp:Transcript_62776/g.178313  ORF Transcript_62776/g.178313 Transcript_62776/m.178313 type:complete len:201 (+) Transcript_62776:67-669(+)
MSALWISTNIMPWVALLFGGMYTMAGINHSFKPDGGKYSIAGFPPEKFTKYTHEVLMFWSGFEGAPQLIRGPLMIASVFMFPEYTSLLLLLDGAEGAMITLICDQGGCFCGVKPLPSPPRGPGAPGGKMIVVKSFFFLACGLMWLFAGKPTPNPLPLWAILIPAVQIPLVTIKVWNIRIPDEAMGLIQDYRVYSESETDE